MQTHRIFKSVILLVFSLSGLAANAGALDGLARYAGIEAPTDTKKADYKVGDRLPPKSSAQAAAAKSPYKKIVWDDLVPQGWDPMADFKKIDFNKLKDSDPRAQEALQRLREVWNTAPVEPKMDGARVSIPGFIVPLEVIRHQITEFLLVPYFGGCIHVPPPPANQIIHVFPAKPLKKGMESMDAVWISGTLKTLPSDTEMGSASYRMNADVVELFKN
jgi:uncharacterized protein